jgi:hypothetical protein
METILNIGHSVYIKSTKKLGSINHKIGKETNNETEEDWYGVIDEDGNKDHYPISDLTPDLFEHYETLPQEVQDVLSKYDEVDTYEGCEAMLKEMEALGYTFEYYLDAVPYNLHKIN